MKYLSLLLTVLIATSATLLGGPSHAEARGHRGHTQHGGKHSTRYYSPRSVEGGFVCATGSDQQAVDNLTKEIIQEGLMTGRVKVFAAARELVTHYRGLNFVEPPLTYSDPIVTLQSTYTEAGISKPGWITVCREVRKTEKLSLTLQ